MKRVIVSEMMSLDGYMAGPDGSLAWHRVSDEYDRYAAHMLSQTSLLVFGRVTYELMAGYWTKAEARRRDPVVAMAMTALP